MFPNPSAFFGSVEVFFSSVTHVSYFLMFYLSLLKFSVCIHSFLKFNEHLYDYYFNSLSGFVVVLSHSVMTESL